jgi:hypothetical protein
LDIIIQVARLKRLHVVLDLREQAVGVALDVIGFLDFKIFLSVVGHTVLKFDSVLIDRIDPLFNTIEFLEYKRVAFCEYFKEYLT